MRRLHRIFRRGLVSTLLIQVLASSAATATDLIVTTTADVVDANDGLTSLREAIAYANTLGGSQTITFSNNTANGAVNFHDGTARTITVSPTNALPNLAVETTIVGPGSDRLTVSASSGFVFAVSGSPTNPAITLSGLTLAGSANVGMGNYGSGQLTLTDVVAANFSSSGIQTKGAVIATGCSFAGSDTGIWAFGGTGAMTVTNCDFSGCTNTGIRGGTGVTALRCTFDGTTNSSAGIFQVGGAVTATACSFANGNSGINGATSVMVTDCSFTESQFAGVFNVSGPVNALRCRFTGHGNSGIISAQSASIADCTITGNQTTGISQISGLLVARNCLIRGDGSNAVSAGAVVMANCEVSGGSFFGISSGGQGLVLTNCTVVNRGNSALVLNNDVGSVTNCTIVAKVVGISGAGNVTVANSIVAGASLANISGNYGDGGHNLLAATPAAAGLPVDGTGAVALQNNGGPTNTVALLQASPALDGGDNSRVGLDPATGQSLTVSGGAGTFTLSFAGQTTNPLDWNAAASAVQAELATLTTIGGTGGTVEVTATSGGYAVTFGGSLADTIVPILPTGSSGATVNLTMGLTPLTTDQRGQFRIRSATVDIGAFESAPARLYVHQFVVGGDGGGETWPNAMPELRNAMAMARTDPNVSEIWVARGTYLPAAANSGDRAATFRLRSGLALYGGFSGGETELSQRNGDPGTNATVLSGDLKGNDSGVVEFTNPARADNSIHVLVGDGTDATAVLDGFTVSGGNATNPNPVVRYGGGMSNVAGSPTLANLAFSGNSGEGGGGIYNVDNSHPALTHVTFSGNGGGGMLNVRDCSPTLTKVGFIGNTGSGVYNVGNSSPTLTDVAFIGNSATVGAGMTNADRCNPTLVNVIFAGNSAMVGSGMINSDRCNPTLVNVTFSGNDGFSEVINSGSDCSPTIRNSILWDNGGAPFGGAGTPTITDSIVQGGYAGPNATNIIDQDPLFVAPITAAAPTTTGNLRLRAGSPAVNAGDNGVVTVATDSDGAARIIGANVDLGAYELIAPPTLTNTQLTAVHGGSLSDLAALTGASPEGGVFSGTGVSVDGNGRYNFDSTGILLGTQVTVTYTISGPGGSSNISTLVVTVTETPSLTVTTTSDTSTNTDGLTSLREAIAFANSGNAGPDPEITFSTTAGNGAENFHDGAARTITLTQGLLGITNDVSIVGPGSSRLTVSGDARSVLEIPHSISPALRLSGVTLAGTAGSGISNLGTGLITLTDVVAENFSQSAVLIFGAMTAEDCRFKGGVHGILASGSGDISVTDCEINGGSAGLQAGGGVTALRCKFDGAIGSNLGLSAGAGPVVATRCSFANSTIGIQAFASLMVTDCSFTENGSWGISGAFGGASIVRSTFVNAGVFITGHLVASDCTFRGTAAAFGVMAEQVTMANCLVDGYSEGIGNNTGELVLTNCTVVNQSIRSIRGSAKGRLTNCTIAGSPYGFTNQTGLFTVSNCVFAGNATAAILGNFDGGHNLFALTAAEAGLAVDGNGKVLLRNNGGATATVALLADSPAIDQGDNALVGLDPASGQRLTVTPGGSGYTLSFGGATTGTLALDASATTVQDALMALPTIGGSGGTVTVTATAGGYDIAFGGSLAGTLHPLVPAATLGMPVTVTMGLTPLTTDQRGQARVTKGNVSSAAATVDIGAYEFPAAPTFTTDALTIISGSGTLDLAALTGATPAGGSFSGTGVTGSTFDPTGLALGSYTVTYTVSDGFGTSNSATFTVTVTEVPSLTVTTAIDTSTNIDGLTSLREAIAYANSGNAVPDPEITFGNGLAQGGTDFTDAVADTILLSGNQLQVTGSMTITGRGADKTIVDGNQLSRIFLVDDGTATEQEVEITGLTVQGGDSRVSGGAIHNAENCVMSDTVFSQSYAEYGGIIYNTGTATMQNCITSGATGYAGGAIYNTGMFTLIKSRIADGVASLGGGIFNEGTFVSYGNIVINNEVAIGSGGEGGGVFNLGHFTSTNDLITENVARSACGGVLNRGTFLATNVTITENVTLWCALENRGTLSTTNVSITNNTGSLACSGVGISGNAVWNARNTIVAGNSAADVLNSTPATATVNADHVIIGDLSYSGPGVINSVPVTVAELFIVDADGNPLLGDYGGPTPTIALAPGSPAIDAGDNALAVDPDNQPLTTDQRGVGFPRITKGLAGSSAATVDLGAFEVFGIPTFTTDALTIISGSGTLDLAALTGATPAGGSFSGTGVTGSTFDPTGLALGPYTVTYTVNDGFGTSNSATFTVTVGEVPSLTVTTTSDTSTNTDGLTSLREAIAFANSGNAGADPEITFGNGAALGGTDFTDEVADTILLSGKQLHVTGSMTITGRGADKTIVDGNQLSRIFLVDDGTVTEQEVEITGLTVQRGVDGGIGGGILNTEDLAISECVISGNQSLEGGGIFNFGDLTLTESRMTNNSAYGGGAISNRGPFRLSRSRITENQTFYEGGGIYNLGSFVSDGNTMSNNHAAVGSGGGVYNEVEFASTNDLIIGNSADSGGGVWNSGSFVSTNVTITNNFKDARVVSGVGGVVNQGSWTARNTVVVGNGGGDVFGSVNADHVIIGDRSYSGPGVINTAPVTVAELFIVDGDGNPILADYGGPTPTIALAPGSPAIDAGDNALAVDADSQPLTTDQRGVGFPRITKGLAGSAAATVDLGAFELLGIPTFTTDALTVISGSGTLDLAALTGATPSGGSFSGTGVTGSTFDPTGLALGPYTVTYTVSDGFGTSNSATFTVTVTEIPSLTVTTVGDTVDPLDGLTSLREAITHANDLGGAREVTFDPTAFAAPQTISLTTGLPEVTCDLAITGTGARSLTLADGTNTGGGGSLTLLSVTDGSHSITGMTLAGGATGLSAENATDLAISACVLRDHGVAVTTGSGVSATILGTTIHGNTTGLRSGEGSTMSAINLTVADNVTGIANTGTFLARHATITGNDTGLSNELGATLANTICAGNGTDIAGSQAITEAGDNLIGMSADDAGLDPVGLRDNGGPTDTVRLLPGSPAIDAGDPAHVLDPDDQPLTSDQRGSGFARVAKGSRNSLVATADIGAFELFAAPEFLTDEIEIQIDGQPLDLATATGVSPTGGFFEGPGVSGGFFDPRTQMVGSYEITYTYTGDFGIINSSTFIIDVIADGGSLFLQKAKAFPLTQVGRKSKVQRLSLSNRGDLPVSGIRLVLRGAGRKDFKITQPVLKTLAPLTSTTWRASFHPKKPGSRRATVMVLSKGGAGTGILKGKSTTEDVQTLRDPDRLKPRPKK